MELLRSQESDPIQSENMIKIKRGGALDNTGGKSNGQKIVPLSLTKGFETYHASAATSQGE